MSRNIDHLAFRAKVTALPTAAPGPVKQSRGRRPAHVPTLEAARTRRREAERSRRALEITLLEGGELEYTIPRLTPQDTFQALLGCYLVMGELLVSLEANRLPTAK